MLKLPKHSYRISDIPESLGASCLERITNFLQAEADADEDTHTSSTFRFYATNSELSEIGTESCFDRGVLRTPHGQVLINSLSEEDEAQ